MSATDPDNAIVHVHLVLSNEPGKERGVKESILAEISANDDRFVKDVQSLTAVIDDVCKFMFTGKMPKARYKQWFGREYKQITGEKD